MVPRRPSFSGSLLLLILLLAALVRFPALFSDFWLDEIWSLFGVRPLTSVWEIYTRFNRDNNHQLNSLLLYALGEHQPWIVYRLGSYLAGVGTVLIGWLIGRRQGIVEAFYVALLLAGSYLLIHFSSEARGYAPAIFFALAGWWCLLGFAAEPRSKIRWRWAGLFGLCAILGFLSHLSYWHAFAAGMIWLPFRLRQRQAGWPTVLGSLAQVGLIPGLFLVAHYLFFVRGMTIGGGEDYVLVDVLVKTFSYLGGGPPSGLGAGIVALTTWLSFLGAILLMGWQADRRWIFLLVAIFLSPALLLALLRPAILYERYFLLGSTFGLIAIGLALARGHRQGGLLRIGALLVLIFYLVGNGLNTLRLIRYGRGGYQEGVRYLAQHTTGSVIEVASDQDFRNGMVLQYYQRFLPPHKKIHYWSTDEYPKNGPQWFLFHRQVKPARIPHEVVDPFENHYQLKKVLPYADLSGWTWYIYQKVP